MRPVKVAAILLVVLFLSLMSWLAQGGEKAWAGSGQSPEHQTIPFTRTPAPPPPPATRTPVPPPPADTPGRPTPATSTAVPTATPTVAQPTTAAINTATKVPTVLPTLTATRASATVTAPVLTPTATASPTTSESLLPTASAIPSTIEPTAVAQPTSLGATVTPIAPGSTTVAATTGGPLSLVGAGCLLGGALIVSGILLGLKRKYERSGPQGA
jgi:hypothetical protein